MDREEIIRMAKEAGLDDPHAVVHAYCELKLTDHLERFAALIVAEKKTEWVGLTDEEIYDYADKYLYQHGSNYCIKAFGKAIEAKLKERNT
jgi:hypothetical protein